MNNYERLKEIKKRRYGLIVNCPYCKNHWFDSKKDHLIDGTNIEYKLQCPYCEKLFVGGR